VITPRRTQLVRVPDLHAFRHAIRALNLEPGTRNPEPGTRNPDLVVVVVPTRSAAKQLGTGLTREELYQEFHARLTDPPRRLTAIERDVIAQASARAVADAGAPLAFQLRPGLIAEMLRFYDHLRRQSQSVARFEALIAGALGDEDEADRGAVRMRQQTRFLADTFREYERRVRATHACDEHILRDLLIATAASDPVRRVIVTVADWIADDEGLYVADFDLLSRIPGLESLDIVATEGVLRSGFEERLHAWLPGIENDRGAGTRDWGLVRPLLVTPDADEPWFTRRDREEELIAVARMAAAAPERTAVVFKRPLPYLYLAGEVFGDMGLAHQASDALPLAAEPTAAAFDLVLDAASSDFTRDALIALLRSPHYTFEIDRAAVSALDRALSEARYLGGLERLEGQEGHEGQERHAVIVGIARELAPLQAPRRASEQLRTLLAFWAAHARPLTDDDPFASRERRSRTAIVDALESLAAVHAEQDDPLWTIEDLALAVRRTIEDQTFVPETGGAGVQLLDDSAARYGDFDDLFLVGLVENEWPEKPRRNIFYPSSLLKALGWPTEKDRRAAADARFLDLISSAAQRTIVSTFTLDDDAIVMRSMQLDEIPRARLSSVTVEPFDQPPSWDRFEGAAPPWVDLRTTRGDFEQSVFHGTVGSQPPRPWSVSALETYLGCPFKFYAQHVLKLDEEPDDEEVMDPRRQGQLVHEVFERFFAEWQAAGRATITGANLDAARALFEQVVDRALEHVPPAEAGLERTRLLGSPAAAGLGEAVFRMEAERPTAVVARLLEHRLEGAFRFTTSGGGQREIALRGKADRIDLLEDGTFRLIDYKLGWPPDRSRALQLPIYSVCAQQRLASYRGRSWTLGEAAYLAFKGPRRVVPLFATGARDKVLADAQQRLADTVDAIGRGEFPPAPDDVYRCETCTFASVCRKDYVGEV
jgi:RecB family exonuclease